MYGTVTFQKVCHSEAPRSFDASSSERSKPAIRERTTTVTNGKLKATWLTMIGDRSSGQGRPLGQPSRLKKTSSATPMQISGMTMGRARRPRGGAAGEAEAPQGQRQQGADHGGGDTVEISAITMAVDEGLDQRAVAQRPAVIVEGEALPDDVAPAVVEAEGDQADDRRIEEDEDRGEPEPQPPAARVVERCPAGQPCAASRARRARRASARR